MLRNLKTKKLVLENSKTDFIVLENNTKKFVSISWIDVCKKLFHIIDDFKNLKKQML